MQKVHKKIVDFYTTSTKAKVDATDTLSCITAAKITDWKGNAEPFIFHWQDQIRLCETLTEISSHLNSTLKLTLLQNAATSNTYLRAVKDQADQLSSHKSDTTLSYDQYCSLLLSDANNYDSQFVATRTNNPRKIHSTEVGDHNFYYNSPSTVAEEFECDVDAPASTLLDNITNRNNSNFNTYLPPEDFNYLTHQGKDS